MLLIEEGTQSTMRSLPSVLLGLGLAACLQAQQIQPPHTTLKVGDMAPDFTLTATTGQKVTLSDFRGKNAVVLAFFPAAFTGG
jgi:hypothetical protein